MKKVVALLSLALLTLGACSSDDNKGNDKVSIEVGESHSTDIKTPEWLHGTWVPDTDSEVEFDVVKFRITKDDVCMLTGITQCFKGIVKELLRVSKDNVNVYQKYEEDYYQLDIDFPAGTVVEMEFYRLDDNRMGLVQSGASAVFVRK